jgi:hypothetical protein
MFVLPFRPAYDSNGRFAPGAQAWFTLSETNTPTPVYSDEDLTLERPNPLVADGLGKFPRSYLDPDVEYRLRVYVEGAVVGIDDPLTDHDYDPYTPSEQGAQGARGENALIFDPVVPTTTLAPGAPATASTAPVGPGTYQLSLGIPQGAPGLSGALSNGDYGDIVVSGGGAALTIDIGAVTLAKIAGIAPMSILGNNTGSATTPIELTAAQAIALLGLDARYVQNSTPRIWSVYIPASSMKPRATNPPAAGSTETAANKINLDTLDFDAVTTEYAQFVYAMPKSWNEAAVTVQFIWTADGSGTAVWGVQAVSFNHGNAIDAAFGAAQTVTETGGAGVIAYSAFTAPVTPGGDPASDFSALIFQVYRAGGTLASDAKLIGIRLNFVTEAQTDA